MAGLTVRAYSADDLEDVRKICFDTGYMGKSIAWQYRNRAKFCEMFCDWHVLNHPDSAWVVDRGGRAVGYLIGCPDAREMYDDKADWPADLDAYPADLHINLLRTARGHGLGRELMSRWFERLAELGVPGVHLGTWGENRDAIAFFESVGFTEVGERTPNMFRLKNGRKATVAYFTRPIS